MKVRKHRSIKTQVILSTAALASLACLGSAGATSVISGWDFQNLPISLNLNPVSDLGTVNGSAAALGMTNTYGTPNNSQDISDVLASNGSSDTAAANNAWRVRGGSVTAGLPANGWSSLAPIGSQGAQFTASTAGFTNVTISFDIETTTQGEGKLQLQYTTNGASWSNAALAYSGTGNATVQTNSTSANTVTGTFIQFGAGTWYKGITADLTGFSGVSNNASFAIRLVNAATGADNVNQAGAALNNTSGNWRFDEVLFLSGSGGGGGTTVAGANLTWTPGSINWNTNTANTNWVSTNAATVAFATKDNVNFTGNGITGGTGIVNVDIAGVTAGAISMSHTNGTYIIQGGAIAGGPFTKTGGGNLVIASPQNFSALKILGGTLHTTADNQLGTSNAQLTLDNSATFFADAPMTIARSVSIGTNGATFNTGANAVTISGTFANGGNFVKAGTGDLTLGGAASTTREAAFILPSNSGNVHLNAPDTFTIALTASTNAGTINGDLIIDGNNRLQFNGGFVDGTGRIIVKGTNATVIATTADANPTTTQINIPIIYNPNHLLNFTGTFGESQSNNTMIVMPNAVISGDASINFANHPINEGGGGQGQMEIYAQHTYTGDTIINNANFALERLNVNNVFPIHTNVIFGSGTNNLSSIGGIDLNGFNQTVASLKADVTTLPAFFATAKAQVVAGIFNTSSTLSTLTINGTSTTTLLAPIGNPIANGNIPGAGDNILLHLAAGNTGTLILTGENKYSGGTIIDGGTLQVDASPAAITGISLPLNAEVTNNSRFIINTAGVPLVNGVAVNNLLGSGTSTVTAAGALIVNNNIVQGSLINHGVTTILNTGTIGPVSGTGSLSIGNGGATALASVASLTQASVTVNTLAKLQLVGTPGRSTSTVTALTISGTGQLDVGANTLLVDRTATPFSQILGYVATGRNGNNWNGSGINSSFIATGTNRSKYGLAAIDGGNPLDANVGIPASQIIVRAALIGDAQLSGLVNFADINQIISHGRYGKPADPTLTHWSDGDFNGDSKVDFFDINAIISAGNFNAGGTPFVAEAAGVAHAAVASIHTAKLTSANPAVATTGVSGDGIPDFSYDALTGDVKFFRDGYDASKHIRSVVLLSAANKFITGVGYTAAGNDSFDVDESGQQAVGRFNGNGITVNPLDLGNILPSGLTTSQVQSDLSLYFNYDGSGAADPNGVPATLLGVPEPTTLSLLGLGAVGLLARRRRKAK